MNKLTVILTTYNRVDYLKLAVNSILVQSYKSFDFIILDNGSTDETEKFVKSLENDKIKYIKLEKNIGFCGIKNMAIDICKTKYLMIPDDDDILKPNIIEKEMNLLEKYNDLNMVGTNRTVIDKNGNVIAEKLFDSNGNLYFNQYEYIMYKNKVFFCCPSVIYRTNILKKNNINFNKYVGAFSDIHIYFQFNVIPGKIVFISEPLIYYRRHVAQNSISVDAESLKSAIRMLEVELKYAVKNNLKAICYNIKNAFPFSDIFNKMYMFDESYIFDMLNRLQQEEYLSQSMKLKVKLFKMLNDELVDINLGDFSCNDFESFCLKKWVNILINDKTLGESLYKKGYKNIAIFGTYLNGYLLCKDFKKSDLNVNFFIDNNANKNRSICDVCIYNVDILKKEKIDALIISNENDITIMEIKFQIRKINSSINVYSWKELCDSFNFESVVNV